MPKDDIDVARLVYQLDRFPMAADRPPSRPSMPNRYQYTNGVNMSTSHDSALYSNGEPENIPPMPYVRRESRPLCRTEASGSRDNIYQGYDNTDPRDNASYHNPESRGNGLGPSVYPQQANGPVNGQQRQHLPVGQLLNGYLNDHTSDFGEVSDWIRRREEASFERNHIQTHQQQQPARQREPDIDRFYEDRNNRFKTFPGPPTDRSRSQPPSEFKRDVPQRKSFARSMAKKIRKLFGGSSSSSSKKPSSRDFVPPAPLSENGDWRSHQRNHLGASHPSLHEAVKSELRSQSLRRKNSNSSFVQEPPKLDKVEDFDSGNDSPVYSHNMPPPLLLGLPNLGNTCYMNAVVQALAASESLFMFFNKGRHTKTLQERTRQQEMNSRQHGSNGAVTRALATLLSKLYSNKCTDQDIRDFRIVVGEYSPDYRTYNQQDAQEFLNWLLDKVHEDLNIAKRDTNSNYHRVADMSPDDALAERRLTHYSVITDLFEGQLRSSVVCNSCQFSKNNFEPYMYVSLPVPYDPNEIKRPLFVTVVKPSTVRMLRYGIRVDAKGTLGDVKACLCDETNILLSQMLVFQITPSGFYNNVSDGIHVANLYTNEAYAVELSPNADDYTKQTLSIVFVISSRNQNSMQRESHPFVITVSRQMSFDAIARKMLEAVKPVLPPRILDFNPMGQFRIGLMDGSFLDDGVTMPLLTQAVEMSIQQNERIHRHLPKFLRVVMEFPSSPRLMLRDSDRVMNHRSADCLHKETAQKEITLQNCLNGYTTEESCEWRCERCFLVGAKKQLKFNSLPQILILHLKRFRHGTQDLSEPVKIDVPVMFPLDGLDMSQYVAQTSRGRSESTSTRRPSRDTREPAPNDHIYDLFAVVNHKGDRVSSGHYTATIRNPADGQWRTFDDTVVTQNTDPRDQSANTYLMFYEKRSARLDRQNSRRTEETRRRFPTGSLPRIVPTRDSSLTRSKSPSSLRMNGSAPFQRGDVMRRAATPASVAAAAAKAGLMLPLQTSKTHQIAKGEPNWKE